MLTYDLDRRGKLARYDYLYRCIREDILAGRLTAGEKLPSKRSLASHLQTWLFYTSDAADERSSVDLCGRPIT